MMKKFTQLLRRVTKEEKQNLFQKVIYFVSSINSYASKYLHRNAGYDFMPYIRYKLNKSVSICSA